MPWLCRGPGDGSGEARHGGRSDCLPEPRDARRDRDATVHSRHRPGDRARHRGRQCRAAPPRPRRAGPSSSSFVARPTNMRPISGRSPLWESNGGGAISRIFGMPPLRPASACLTSLISSPAPAAIVGGRNAAEAEPLRSGWCRDMIGYHVERAMAAQAGAARIVAAIHVCALRDRHARRAAGQGLPRSRASRRRARPA